MTEQAKTQNRVPPADAANPFFSFANIWRGEAQRVLDETTAAMEKSYGEWERTVSETSRFSTAQARAMHDASRALLSGARVMLG